MRDKSPEEIQKLKEKLTRNGFEELTTAEDVDAFLSRPGTKLIVINSVCSCAGEAVRDGVVEAVQSSLHVDHMATVFAGVDDEATEKVRKQAPEMEPSSPAIYLFDGNKAHTYIPRKYTMKHQYQASKVTERLHESVRELNGASVS